ncbi:hypothetical protein [Kocuria marina]|uniref:hypothetical protein n=1 Tax=Kocuria marina TaxID=223184 RepID=UPI00384D3C9E
MAPHDPTTHETTGRSATPRREQRKVVAGTIIGTSTEWYDFFLYASAAGLVFNHLFFEPMGPQAATLAAFATAGRSFLFRPLGAFLARPLVSVFPCTRQDHGAGIVTRNTDCI